MLLIAPTAADTFPGYDRVLTASGATDRGTVRPTNEDCFLIDPHAALCVVADGMGGHNAGEVASRIAVETIVEQVRDATPREPAPDSDDPSTRPAWPFGFDDSVSDIGNVLRTAVHVANDRILESSAVTGAYAGMGTTVVAALVHGQRLSIAHVGDSRLYIVEGGQLRQLTADDSWVALRNPGADHSMLRNHPMKHVLTNVVGARLLTGVHVTERMLSGGELLVLTTDGVHSVLDDRRIEQVMARSDEPAQIAASLVAAAIAGGSRDNCTAVVARYEKE